MKHELAEKFLFELSCLCVPELYLKYHLIKILKNFDGTKIKDDLRNLEENIAKKLKSSINFKSIEDSFKKFQKKNTGLSFNYYYLASYATVGVMCFKMLAITSAIEIVKCTIRKGVIEIYFQEE